MANENLNKDFLSKRLKDYNKTAKERTEIYEKASRRYFQINLTLASALITTLTFFISFFNNRENLTILNFFIIIIIGASISLLIIFASVIYEFLGNDTDFEGFTRKTISFYKGNVPKNNKPDKLKEFYEIFESNFKENNENFIKNNETLIKDDIKNLFVLHYYASNYQRIAINNRKLLKLEVMIIFGSIILQLIYCAFLIFSIGAFYIITICFIIGAYLVLNPIAKITIAGVYAFLNLIKKRNEKILNLLKNLLKRFGVKDSQSHL